MFSKSRTSRSQEEKSSMAGLRRALTALAMAGSLGAIALATPMAASASTLILGPGGINENINMAAYPSSGQVFTSGPLTGCEVWVGDHWRSDARAAGQADLWCNAAHSISMKVYLDYNTPIGLRTFTSYSGSGTVAADGWEWVYTNGACEPGGRAQFSWTTYAEISVDGSAWQWFTSRQNVPYTIPAC